MGCRDSGSSEERRILTTQACFQHYGNKPVMMTDHCESGVYIKGAKSVKGLRCLRGVAKSMMYCNVCVEFATSSVVRRCP